jgi:ankyrin repeat protein
MSFKHRGRGPGGWELAVADWLSHGNTEKLTGKTEKQGWYDGHYLLNGEVECRMPGCRDKGCEAWIKRTWPTAARFMRWCLDHGAGVNSTDESGNTAFMKAVWEKNLTCAKLLLKHGADPNAKNAIGYTALMHAAYLGHTACIKLLLKYGANPRAKNMYGQNALTQATKWEHTDCARLLRAAMK